MRIGFDVSQAGKNKAGCGYFADGLINALTKQPADCEYVLYPSFGDFFFDSDNSQSFQIEQSHVSYGPRHRTIAEATSFWKAADLEQRLEGVDIVHANNFWCPRQPLEHVRLVYTLYDLSFLEEPGWTTETNRSGCFHGVFGAATTADWIVSISHATRDHFLRVFPSFPEERVKVIFPASRFSSFEQPDARPKCLDGVSAGNYWLSVGTIEPRKNHERLLQAYAKYRANGGRSMPLVLAGGSGWLMGDFSQLIAELGLSNDVIVTGYVTDQELCWLYRNCHAHIYVSLFEGFGMPVLEGMQCGAPTIASRSTSIPEITGNAAILVDPTDVDAIAGALALISDNRDLCRSLSQRARAQAQNFGWDMSAGRLLDVYQLAREMPKRLARRAMQA